jgi:hypothetical protein
VLGDEVGEAMLWLRSAVVFVDEKFRKRTSKKEKKTKIVSLFT